MVIFVFTGLQFWNVGFSSHPYLRQITVTIEALIVDIVKNKVMNAVSLARSGAGDFASRICDLHTAARVPNDAMSNRDIRDLNAGSARLVTRSQQDRETSLGKATP